ncbi:MAG: nitrous oxide reductase accessory protein NosL [Brevundimonas sp.]|uniref:nitrous oxide reductase accessory protein NosL n=1 Tax=Brevundimonas sp. TaxID=1871086 RepID=UPI002732EE9E|nr:nitrous oxide reductase accessory protein NosL [Brevundimonas sp.]MDP3377876.1 nitrous oxide reductase accessory protein NosL [Brevundimonas sp.]
MKKTLALILLLAACRDETVQAIDPVQLTADALDHYCQMNVIEHTGPKAQIHLEGLPGAPLFFAQVRDAVAYLRMPEQSHRILVIWVNDMGAEGATWQAPGDDNWVDARSALYVIGSSQMGGMGSPELVPFTDRAQAEAFAAAYGGRVVDLAEVPDSAVIAPEEPAAIAEDAEYHERLKALADHGKAGG